MATTSVMRNNCKSRYHLFLLVRSILCELVDYPGRYFFHEPILQIYFSGIHVTASKFYTGHWQSPHPLFLRILSVLRDLAQHRLSFLGPYKRCLEKRKFSASNLGAYVFPSVSLTGSAESLFFATLRLMALLNLVLTRGAHTPDLCSTSSGPAFPIFLITFCFL